MCQSKREDGSHRDTPGLDERPNAETDILAESTQLFDHFQSETFEVGALYTDTARNSMPCAIRQLEG